MWNTLEVTHEGTNEVKRARKHTLIQEYEMFRMLKGETITEVQKRFTHIIDHLMSLEKTFEKEELNIKILKCLDRSCQPISDESDEENLSLLSRKFSKFLKRNRNKDTNKERYGNKKSNDFNSNNYTCFGCGEQGHIKADCPNKESKEKKSSYKEKKGKSKRAYIA